MTGEPMNDPERPAPSAPDSSDADPRSDLVYAELRRLARRAMSRQAPGHTLQTTALLHEAWLRLEKVGARWESEEHFLAVAARAMRSVLVDHARRRSADKRGGGRQRVDLDDLVDVLQQRSADLLALDEALAELARLDEELGRIVELRFFGGLKHPAIADLLGVSLRRVERGWSTARSWLYTRLSSGDTSGPS